jgi:HlyD family secretion protein
VSGIIKKIYVDFNSVVREGQVIAVLDTILLAQAVDDARVSLKKSEILVNQTKREYERTKVLFEQKVMAQADYDLALTSYETAQANVISAKSSLNRSMINLKYATIIAPISGVVVSRAVDVGQTVAASFSTPTMFTIANDLTKMQVQANIDEGDIGKILVGQLVKFTVDAHPDQTFEGTIQQVRLQPVVTQNVVNYTVIIDVPNPDLKLLPGMTANITVMVKEEKDILKVPSIALRFSPPQEYIDAMMQQVPDSIKKKRELMSRERGSGMQGGSGGGERSRRGSFGMLWVKVGDSLKPRRVRTGITDGLNTEVRGKIEEGEEVVLSMTSSQTTQSGQQQQNPFAPQMPRGTTGRGGR